MADKLKIHHPKPGKPVLPRFVVVGRAMGNIADITFDLKKDTTDVPGRKGFRTGNRGQEKIWAILVPNAPKGDLKLTVRGYAANGTTLLDTATLDIKVVPYKTLADEEKTYSFPDFWHPQDLDDIRGEAWDFIAYGPCSADINFCNITPDDVSVKSQGDSYFFTDFWVSQFPPMTPDDIQYQFLRVADVVGSAKSIQVYL